MRELAYNYVMTFDKAILGLRLMQDGLIVEITEEYFDYYLGCVPPIRQRGLDFVCGEPVYPDHFMCFVNIGTKFYAAIGTVQEFDEGKMFEGT